MLSASEQQTDDLVRQLATRELQYREASAARLILSASATPRLAAEVFGKLCEVQRAASAGVVPPLVFDCIRQLRGVLREIPVETAVTGIMQALSGLFDANAFHVVVNIFGEVNADAEELRSAMPDALRQRLRSYVKDGINEILAGNLFDAAMRSQAAITLARIGDPEDLVDLRRLIDADIAQRRANPSATNYSNWFVHALLMLAAPGADAVLIDLLPEQRYENWAASALLQLAMPPSRERAWLGNVTNFEAIWAARAGARPPGFDAIRAKYYAQALARRMEALRQESLSAAKSQHHVGRIKGLAVLLASLDGRDSANFVLEALTPPLQWDGLARMSGIRALLISGVVLPFDSMLAVLDPTIEHILSRGFFNDENISLLIDCLELLPFSDDPVRAIARIEEVIGRFKYRHYKVRDLITAMGHTRSEAAVPFLLNLARKGGLQNMEDTWIEAMGRLDVPGARDVLLSFIDPQIPWIDLQINFNHHTAERFAVFVAEWARQDLALRQRLIDLSERSSLTPTQKQLLPAIYHELGGDAVIAGCNLLQGALSPYFGRERGLETEFLERRPYGRSNYFVLVPRDAERARAELFRAVLNNPTRRQAAFSILGQAEVWRIEHGRPIGEPRHPMIESSVPWPPLSIMQ